jgi:N-carbamoylputrescine amidase
LHYLSGTRAVRNVVFAVSQFSCTADGAANVAKAEALVRAAAAAGANVVLLQELFASLYFCQEQQPAHFALAESFDDSPLIARFSGLARELNVVLPLSFFEKAGQAYFNSLAMIDADGRVLGLYRKSHIPDGPGYQEKYYFSPGDTGFKVWPTRFGRLGAAICWDQWFPEAARVMALQGAEALLYPTAIGSEPPPARPYDSRDAWRAVMCGHAAANALPVLASNRIGNENTLTFYGSSFVADGAGAVVAELGRQQDGFALAAVDLDAAAAARAAWGLFRDRRPELYGGLRDF